MFNLMDEEQIKQLIEILCSKSEPNQETFATSLVVEYDIDWNLAMEKSEQLLSNMKQVLLENINKLMF